MKVQANFSTQNKGEIMYPKLKVAQTYLLNCMYSQNGQNEIPLLLVTNIDLDRLMQTDFIQYLKFVQEQLAESFDFANYQSDSNISKVLDVEREKGEDFDLFIARVVNETPLEKLKHHIQSQNIPIEVNRSYPSDFDGYQVIPEDHAKVLLEYFPSNRIVEYLI